MAFYKIPQSSSYVFNLPEIMQKNKTIVKSSFFLTVVYQHYSLLTAVKRHKLHVIYLLNPYQWIVPILICNRSSLLKVCIATASLLTWVCSFGHKP